MKKKTRSADEMNDETIWMIGVNARLERILTWTCILKLIQTEQPKRNSSEVTLLIKLYEFSFSRTTRVLNKEKLYSIFHHY